MKKKLLIFAVAGFALASCSSDETTASLANSGANEISFRPLNGGVTRAADITGFTSTPFMVRAMKGDPAATYFPETQYSYDSGASAWTSTNKYYWPSDDGVLTFYAYAPTSNAQFTHTTGENTFVVTPSTTATEQVDLVYATATGQKSTSSTGVTLTFGHVESKVIIKLLNSNPNLKITANKVVIGNVKNKGTYTMGTGWDLSAASNTSYTQSFSGTEYTTAAQAGVDMILIPQTLTNATAYSSSDAGAEFDGSYIKVDLKIQNNVSPYAYIVGANDGYVTALFPLPATTWTPGYKYIYSVDLAGGGYYPTNTSAGTGDALDPILAGAEIKFVTVTVSDWTPYDGDGNGSADADGDSDTNNDPINVGM